LLNFSIRSEALIAKTVSVINQKGGVGKTTTAVNLSAAIGALGKKVLLVDIDPQGNSTSGYGINKREIESSTYDMLINGVKASDVLVKTRFENVDILPSDMNLAGAEVEMIALEKRESLIKMALSQIWNDYDYIFLDCPPSLGLITINALCASDTFLVPIQCEYYALEGLAQLMATVRQIKRLYNPQLELEGVLLTMYDGRLNLTNQVVDEVKKFFPKKVYSSTIPRNVRLSEAPSYGEPIMYYDKASKGAIAYAALAEEFLKKQ
jgi:chromosome partitioning protein